MAARRSDGPPRADLAVERALPTLPDRLLVGPPGLGPVGAAVTQGLHHPEIPGLARRRVRAVRPGGPRRAPRGLAVDRRARLLRRRRVERARRRGAGAGVAARPRDRGGGCIGLPLADLRRASA